MGIRAYLQKRRLATEDRNITRQKKIKNLSEIKNVLAVISLNSLQDYEKWKQIFKNISKNSFQIEWICYLSDFGKNIDLPANVVTKYDVNFLGFPRKGQFLKEKFAKTYDLTLDLNFDNVYLLNWIWVILNSNLRVGSDYKKNMLSYYDFTMSTKDPVNQSKLFIDQVFYFLDTINK